MTALHRRIEERRPISVDYLVEQLRVYLDEFVQTPPYHLVANSMGGKVAVEFAVRHPEQVARLVLLCPSGLADKESLPIIEGVRRSDMEAVVHSVFHDVRAACPGRLRSITCVKPRTSVGGRASCAPLRGTMDHRVRNLLPRLTQPTLLVVGRHDRIVNPQEAIEAARLLPRGKLVVLPDCGHAPQIEAARTINRLVGSS